MAADFRNLLITKEPINFYSKEFNDVNLYPIVHSEFKGLHLYFAGSRRLSAFDSFSNFDININHKICEIEQNDCGSGVYLLLHDGTEYKDEPLYAISDDFVYRDLYTLGVLNDDDRDDVEEDFYKLLSCAFEQFNLTVTRKEARDIGNVYRELSWSIDEHFDEFNIELDIVRI